MTWGVLLVLALGLPRLLVVCTGPHRDSRIEFVHQNGTCGHDHEGEDDAAVGDRGVVAREGHDGCVDLALDIDTGPLPQRVVFDPPSPSCLPAAASLVPESLPPLAAAVRPPTTGPPRTDQGTELLASTRLLL